MPCANNGQYGNVHCPLNICKYEKDERKTFFRGGEVWRLFWREEGYRASAQIPGKFKVREWRGWICQRRRVGWEVEGDVWKRKSKSLFTGV